MSDYSQIVDFSAKDALSSGDPSKLIKGSEHDAEFAAISTAIATKYDSDDLASQAQAEAGSSTSVLLSPGRLTNWAQYNGGMVYDLWALSDPNADRLLFWDDSAGAAALLTLSTGLTISTTNITIDTTVVPQLGATTNAFTGTGLTLTNAANPAFSAIDSTNSVTNVLQALDTTAVVGTTSAHQFGFLAGNSLRGFFAADGSEFQIDVTLFDLNANLDVSGTLVVAGAMTLSGALTTPNTSASEAGFKGVPVNTQDTDYTLVLTDAGKTIYKSAGGAGETITIPANASVAFPIGTVIQIVNRGGGDLTVAITSDTLEQYGTGSTGSRTLADKGKLVIEKLTSTLWMCSGTGVS